jgi:hypothetical protein
MRGKVAKRLRLIARISCAGDAEVYRKTYRSLVKAWKESHRNGEIARIGQRSRHATRPVHGP